jgi:hypothetical protein
MTRPGHASREGEVPSLREIVLQLGLKVVDMGKGGSSTYTSDVTATLDGGDVCIPGDTCTWDCPHDQCGRSITLQEAFPHIRVIACPTAKRRCSAPEICHYTFG